MKTNLSLAAVITALIVWAWPASAQVRVLDERVVSRILNHLEEVDFENLPLSRRPFDSPLPNPLVQKKVTFCTPGTLRSGFGSAPTCQPDLDNSQGGNIVLFLNPGSTISFAQMPKVAVLDIQGIGANPFTLVVTDRRGRRRSIASQGKMFGVTLLGVAAPSGIASVKVQRVGGSGGPLSLARVLFTK